MKKRIEAMVIDTTVLNNFLQAGHVGLLQRLPCPIWICPAVYREIQQGMSLGKVPQESLEGLPIVVLTDEEETHATYLRSRLGAGEAESIAVAFARSWRLATDDRDARRVAAQLRVVTTGTVGILVYCIRCHTNRVSKVH
jgi:predicted nucleic acid-binding protein